MKSRLEDVDADTLQTAVVKVKLKESFLVGPLYDQLEIETWDERMLTRNDLPGISPVLILSFVEGVLGYRFMGDIGNTLMYRRDRPFEG